MFGTLCNEKNNIFYKSKEELLREKPNCKVEVCSICLLPFINNNKNDINNIIENKTNSNKLTNEKDDFNTSEEISENKNKIQIIVYDNKILKQKNKSIWNKNKCNFKKLKKIIKNIFKKYFWDYYYHKTKYLKEYVMLECGHFFHSECINSWINTEKKCPICRQEISQL